MISKRLLLDCLSHVFSLRRIARDRTARCVVPEQTAAGAVSLHSKCPLHGHVYVKLLKAGYCRQTTTAMALIKGLGFSVSDAVLWRKASRVLRIEEANCECEVHQGGVPSACLKLQIASDS